MTRTGDWKGRTSVTDPESADALIEDEAAGVAKVRVRMLVSNPLTMGTVVKETDGVELLCGAADDEASSGGSGCSFGFKLTEEKFGRMTRDDTRKRPGIRLFGAE